MTTFVKNIYNTPGSNEIQGSITIDPNTLMTTGGTASNITWQNPTQGSVSLTDIQNDIVLDATSGNANVIGNDHAGNASTGDASALANVINIVSSSIGAQHSFLGVVNIYGNLKGDILVPSSLVDNLFGSNAIGGAGSTNGTGGSVPAAPSIDDNTSITNNIHLTAASGGADVSNNDHAGDATTGSATTNLTVFNLTGQAVIAKNSLLVFVNVLGKWVGVIINAPAGSTAAALSGNLSGNSSGTPATNQQSDGSFNNTVNITNNITATATSGNAAVTGNDHAGNATSGNATASANILNLVHSSFSLDDWFGVLFINVIGSWLGNFGITSAAPAVTPAPGGDGVQAVKVFRFDSTTAFKPASSTRRSSGSSVTTESEPALATVAATESTGHVLGDVSGNSLQSLPRALGGRDFTSAIAMLAGLFLLLVLTALVLRHRRLVRNHNTSGGGAIG
jgi:hypothetical protein